MKYRNLINAFIIFFAVFFICLQVWLERFFGQVDIEQLAVFILFGFQGLLDTEDYLISKFIQICLYFPVIFTLLYIIFFKLASLLGKNYLKFNFFAKISKFQFFFSLLLFFFSIYNLSKNVSLQDFVLRDKNYDFIKENYTAPNIKNYENIESDQDLVLIYLEGVEDDFIKKDFISKKSIDNLSLSSFGAKDFSEFYQTKYNNWTVGAIISSQCGVPQKPVGIIDVRRKGFMSNRHVFGLKKFLPNIYCLGDLLKLANYKNIFINAVDLKFQAMGAFLNQHGYDELIGKKYFDNLNLQNKNKSWGGGVNDSELFALAKKKIIELKKENKRFNLTLLTTDTHNPGYVDDGCKIKFEESTKKMFRAVSCTAHELNKFVKFIYDNYSNDTSIVIIGDHLNRHIEDYVHPEDLPNLKRSIYNKFVSKNLTLQRNTINHFDLFPTILNILNFDFNGKLGLGYSSVKKTSVNYNAYRKKLEKNIRNKSTYYNEFWK